MLNIATVLYQIIQSKYFFLFTSISAFSIKIYLFALLLKKGSRSEGIKLPWFLLIGVLLGSALGDLSWIIKLVRELALPQISYSACVLAIRFAWAALILQYQSLAIFIESLTARTFKLTKTHKVQLLLSSSFVIYFIYLALFDSELTSEFERVAAFSDTGVAGLPFEVKIMRYASMYLLPMAIVPSLFAAFHNIKRNNLPKILKRQLTILIKYLLSPFLFAEFIIAIHLNIKDLHIYEASLLSISTILISCSVYYCIRKVLDLRFLNFNDQLLAQQRTDFIDTFKEILGQISRVTTCEEMVQITQTFFKQAFSVPMKKTMLYLRDLTDSSKIKESPETISSIEKKVELFFLTHSQLVCDYLKKSKILIYDEITFNQFYQEQSVHKDLITFLDSIHADIFLPIYNKTKIIAYIIIEKNAKKQLYTTADIDEMIILANYVSTIIHLLQHRSLSSLVQQEKELKEELFLRHQEINHYKETLDSFLKSNSTKEIGILFYKKGQFVFGSQTTQQLLQIDPNKHDGHVFTKALKEVGNLVETFKVPKTMLAQHHDRKLMISGMLNIEKNNVILTIYQPEIADILKRKTALLKNPQDWDYLLYLESTKIGQDINAYLPGDSETLLNSKIQMLQCGLSAKPLLLDAHPEDCADITLLMHKASMKQSLHTIVIKEAVTYDAKHALFDHQAHMGYESHLFAHLKNATLMIENIDFLDAQCQENLAQFILSGTFDETVKDEREPHSLRIISSTSKPYTSFSADAPFAMKLLHELKKSVLSVPSLVTLADSDLLQVIEGYSAQLMQHTDFKMVLDLTDSEKYKLIAQRPASISELKKRVRSLLIAKSKKVNLETEIIPAVTVEEPSLDTMLMHAARLGKKALKSKEIMQALWNKFNNQNQIALFLGVNRSSVNRRCKDYNIT